MPVRAQQETSSGHAEGHGLTTEGQLYGHRPAGSNQLTAIPHPKFPQTTTGPGHARDGFDTGRSLVATRLNQLREGNVAARLNQLREGDIAGRLNRLRENC